MKSTLLLLCLFWSTASLCQQAINQGKFEQLALPTPNEYRAGSGAPGPKYWQQQADYIINIVLDEENQTITGSETISYHNHSPYDLNYLWIQLDQNIRAYGSNSYLTRPNNPDLSLYNRDTKGTLGDSVSAKTLIGMTQEYDFDGGFKLKKVQDKEGNPLPFRINQTMMRIDLPKPLQPESSFSFSMDWWYAINDRMVMGQRSGYEYFPEDGNYIFAIAQFHPRMAVYDDINGWQNKQFLGDGEFALTFGNFDVRINVPSDHVVAATGTLVNGSEVLESKQLDRLEKARNSTKPVIIVSESEATRKESSPQSGTKTWHFKASKVRDFAFASSRKFIWDAMSTQLGATAPMAMSFYPKEGNPLWERESTLAVARTLQTYSERTLPYPYPVAISVHTASIGMEYPMICFNHGRPNPDGAYSAATRNGMISVIVHEVGHNFFPMIINSDERQWTWMDEGINSFLQYLTLDQWYENYPHRRGPAKTIIPYMKGDKNFIRPIMTNSEQLVQSSGNAYAKPAAALNILRETIMGEELFDYALKEYSRRWAFKNPSPADFFRTMEDASAVDLDWFWRGWFYSTDHVDLSIENVRWLKVRSENPKMEGEITSQQHLVNSKTEDSQQGFEVLQEFTVSETKDRQYREFQNRLNDDQIRAKLAQKNIYEIRFKNNGGLVMPIVLEWNFEDGTRELEKIPAEIWRFNEVEVVKLFVKEKRAVKVRLDPLEETADVNTTNNDYPKVEKPSRFREFKNRVD